MKLIAHENNVTERDIQLAYNKKKENEEWEKNKRTKNIFRQAYKTLERTNKKIGIGRTKRMIKRSSYEQITE